MSGAVAPSLERYVREVYGDRADDVLRELARYGLGLDLDPDHP